MSEEIETLRSHSLTSVLRREIEKLILSGTFTTGERLNENVLAARFNVSRGPVREACRALSETGLVEIIPNRGVFVRRISLGQASDVYDIRSGLFGLAARLLAAKITATELAELDGLIDRMEEATRGASLDDYYPLNLRFHESILRLAGNPRLTDQYLGLIKELHLFRAHGLLHGGGLGVSNAEHRNIVAALRARDPVAAFEAAYSHVQNAKIRMVAAEQQGARVSSA